MATGEFAVLVFDNGSAFSKVGLAGDDLPQATFPTFLPHADESFNSTISTGHRPVQRGKVVDWQSLEAILLMAFYDELGVEPENSAVLQADYATTTAGEREKMAEIFFETFNAPAIHFARQAYLSLFASTTCSRTSMTGIVVESGDGLTQIVPYFNGRQVEEATKTVELAGSDLTTFLSKLVGQDQLKLKECREIKEKICFSSLNFNEDKEDAIRLRKSVGISTGRDIFLAEERFICPEAIFQPDLLDSPSKGLHQLVVEAINKCPEESREGLFKKIVISGGNTMFQDFDRKLTNEIASLVPSETVVKVIGPEARDKSAWIGGSLLAFSNFDDEWVMKKAYAEEGPVIIDKKCK